MTSLLPLPQTTLSQRTEVVYPSSDGEPLAETSVHIDAIIHAVVALRNYLEGQQAIVLADQFLYYVQGFPKFRVAPDIMVVFNVPPGARDNYKVWEEGQVPAVIFEMTSAGTQERDEGTKKDLYESLDIPEYWQFDPKGEWIPEKLRGYRLQAGLYVPITDGRSDPLKLRLTVEESLIGFYREDTGEKLLASDELIQALRQETLARQEAEALLEQERERAERERSRADRLAAKLRELGEDPDRL
ncbi:MAG: Uma2 family endonuclease [Oculatellaceae cyanobacterium Prado106]|jgi:Uma2 family endonuclease|nr:Uma2 family endonuclease [Oculatellaceae cyanobacterium Prado106]